MKKITLFCLSLLLVFLAAGGACSKTPVVSREESRVIAEEYVKADATFKFDGMADTFKLLDFIATSGGWAFNYEFDSAHSGYGNRAGQFLAQVITPHRAAITIEKGEVKSAVMDGAWDMMKQELSVDIEIALAPIHEVSVTLLKSNPTQVNVYIKGGLRDGCTTLYDIKVTRDGNTINIEVTTKHPSGVFCTAVYTYFEKNVNLGTDFTAGVTYNLNVNDYSATFGI